MIADVKLPNINPIIKIDMVFLTLFAAIITADKTKKAPKLEAIGKDQLEIEFARKKLPKRDEPKINKATPKLAPEEIPRTKGPANGFLNKVCINKPATDKPDPTKIAVIAFGNLKFRTIVCQLSLAEVFPINVFRMSSNGIATEPKLMFSTNKRISKTDKSIKCFLCDFFSIYFKDVVLCCFFI